MPSKQPDWVEKLGDIWNRRDTAGFYELEDVFKAYQNHITEEVEGMKWEGRPESYHSMNSDRRKGYNEALDDVKEIIK